MGVLRIEPPPEVPAARSTAVAARLLPLAMVVAALGMTALYLTSGPGLGRNPMMAFFPVMMVVSALGSLAYSVRSDDRAARIEDGRRGYLSYLAGVDEQASAVARAQRGRAVRRHPDPADLWAIAAGPRRGERRPDDPDFGHVRVGRGPCALETTLVPPELTDTAVGAVDSVNTGAVERLVRVRSTVPGMPVTVALLATPVVTVVSPDGDRAAARALVRAMLCQLAALHPSNTVAIAAIVDRATAPHWDWLKWLPHHRLSGAFDAAGPARRTYAGLREPVADPAVHTVAVVDRGAATELGELPERLTVLVIGTAADGVVLDTSGRGFPEAPDGLSESQALACARRLAHRADPDAGEAGRSSSRWAALIGVPHPDRIDADAAWRPRAPRDRLRVPVGTDDRGAPVSIDLKEAAAQGMGPHGLCVGSTGSGKSEFLRTLALSLVATHPPDELNLVLVDFKGGATFPGFDGLSHVAAVITNLADEAHLVARMRDALTGELTRRQELLRATGPFTGVAEYEAARTGGADLAPLPALLVIVDEFSELLAAHPDFVDLFVAIGRVGRSLGVHLLLASQRLEEGRLRGLEAHLSYRVCLKTFSAAESRAVLGTADAFELPNTPGAGLLKTAAGDLIRFQAAHVSEALSALESTEAVGGGRCAVFTAVPVGRRRVEEARTTPTRRTVLSAVVARLSGEGVAAHRVWLPPLVSPPTLAAVLARAAGHPELVAPIGLVDNAFQQSRYPLLADLRGSEGHVAVVGAPRTGRSTALRTLMLALASGHQPGRVVFHVLDLGGALKSVGDLPHVGSAAAVSDRELVERIVTGVDAEVRRRVAGANRGGDVFLVIDGWAALRQGFDGLDETVTAIAAQGLSVGVHVVIAAARWAELRPALKDVIGTRIELRLGDPAESEVDRRAARDVAARPPGHCLVRGGLEAAIALPRLDGIGSFDGAERAWAAAADVLRRRHPDSRVPTIEALPTLVPRAAVAERSPGAVALGLDADGGVLSLDAAVAPHALVLGEPKCGKTSALRTLCHEVVRVHGPDRAQLTVVDYRRTLLGEVEGEHLRGYAMSPSAAQAQLAEVARELRLRLPPDTVTQRQLRERSWWTGADVYVVVDDYDLVASAASNPLSPLLELLPHAADVGLHLLVARRSGGAARALFDPVLAGLRDHGCLGLVMSAAPDEGVLLGTVRPRALAPGRGTAVVRGRPDRVVQVAWSEPM